MFNRRYCVDFKQDNLGDLLGKMPVAFAWIAGKNNHLLAVNKNLVLVAGWNVYQNQLKTSLSQ